MKTILKSAFLCSLFYALCSTAICWSATTYYVDATNGNDANPGTSEVAPWKTISKVNSSHFQPSDFILFKRGETWREQLTVSDSGASGNPITYTAYGTGAEPIIDGSDLVTTWNKYLSTNIYSASCDWTAYQCFEDGTRLAYEGWHKDIATTAANMSTGEWTLDDANNLIFVCCIDSADSVIEVSRRGNCVKVGGKNYITIDGLNLVKGGYAGVHINTGTDVIVQNCTIKDAYWHNVWAYDTSTNITVDNCSLSYAGGDGFRGTSVATLTVSNCTIFNNAQLDVDGTHQDWTGGIHIWGASSDVLFENNTIYLNGRDSEGVAVVTGNRGGGIHLDNTGTGADGRVVRYNTIYDNERFGVMLELLTYYGEVYYNLIHGNGTTGIELRTKIKESKIYNNVCYDNDGEGILLIGGGEDGSIENNIFKNNISVENDGGELRAAFGGENDGTNGSGNVYTYNCFGLEASNFIEWGNNTYKSTYDGWETAYGSNSYSVESNPLFTNPGSNDFTLKDNSPCIDAGTDVGLTRDFNGTPVPQGKGGDIGTFEYKKDTTPLKKPTGLSLKVL